jgi:hypothetical protein
MYIKFSNPDFKLSTFITSAIDEGDRCDMEGVHSWCSKNKTQLLPNLLKSFMKPSVKYYDHCLAFNASSSKDNSSALARTSCANNRLPFICEPSCEGPACPDTSSCAKNVICIYFSFEMIVNNLYFN